ncbi:MAG: hypothetical protein IJM97_02530 [Clostridia bacterium]|nr:hypothetical protein [Clostridia bacterium]
MKKRQILNIVNFVRGTATTDDFDRLATPVINQIKLMKEHSLRGTFLFEYDTLICDELSALFKDLDPHQFEFGVWHEIVQPQAEACGIEWKGRNPWDHYPHCGFPVGYTKEEREKLVDVLYEKFKEIFGYYPKVFGSWFFDSHTIRYIEEKYETDALCNCKEQFGTDGYTLWGSYYGQGYYPNRNNVFMPAKTDKNQINIPLFRMLGADPVYQYDHSVDIERTEPNLQKVVSLEPAGTRYGGGSRKEWVDWFMKENFNGECLSFGYAQAGQENSFGWHNMEKGLTYQFPLFGKLQKEGKIEVEPLGETGRWYKETFKSTPTSAISAHSAFDAEKNSIWYCTKNYRINIFGENNRLRIRDLHIFSENFEDPYENELCKGSSSVYETLPFYDGNRYTGKGIRGGGFFTYDDKSETEFEKMEFYDNDDGSAKICFGEVVFDLCEDSFKITANKPFTIEQRIGIDSNHLPQTKNLSEGRIDLNYNGVDYSVIAKQGKFADKYILKSENNIIEISFEA